VGIVLSEVQSLAAIVPIVKGAGFSQVSQNRRDLGHPTVKAPLSANEFVASYNATMTAKTGNAALDRATAGLRIHSHGTLVRWGTAGVLK